MSSSVARRARRRLLEDALIDCDDHTRVAALAGAVSRTKMQAGSDLTSAVIVSLIGTIMMMARTMNRDDQVFCIDMLRDVSDILERPLLVASGVRDA